VKISGESIGHPVLISMRSSPRRRIQLVLPQKFNPAAALIKLTVADDGPGVAPEFSRKFRAVLHPPSGHKAPAWD